jgi:hypothetical protein
MCVCGERERERERERESRILNFPKGPSVKGLFPRVVLLGGGGTCKGRDLVEVFRSQGHAFEEDHGTLPFLLPLFCILALKLVALFYHTPAIMCHHRPKVMGLTDCGLNLPNP